MTWQSVCTTYRLATSLNVSFVTTRRHRGSPLKTPRMSSAKDIPHFYVEKRLGNIGLLLAVSDASTSLCYCYIARNGGCIPPQRYRKARVPHRSNIIFRYGTGIGYMYLFHWYRRSDSGERHCGTSMSSEMLSNIKYFEEMPQLVRVIVFESVIIVILYIFICALKDNELSDRVYRYYFK